MANAEEEGVEFVWLSAPVDAEGERRRHRCQGDQDAPRRPRRQRPPRAGTRPGTAFSLKAEMVIKALGFDAEDLPAMFDAPDLG